MRDEAKKAAAWSGEKAAGPSRQATRATAARSTGTNRASPCQKPAALKAANSDYMTEATARSWTLGLCCASDVSWFMA
jgi:hypothetical protein